MNHDLKKLYPEIIKSHSTTPYHFEKREHDGEAIKAYNPICGDRFEVFINRDGNKIMQLYFYGFGCSVSKAATSIMTQSLEGKTLEEALTLCHSFLKFVNNESSPDPLHLSNEFLAFSGVHDFPERLECATLTWKEMKKFLEAKKSTL